MAIGTLVVIILSILVLVLIAFGFGMGWRNLWDKISGTFGGGVNVDSLKQACEYACTTQRTYEYCCIIRSINYQDNAGKLLVEKGTCMNSLIRPACELTCNAESCGTLKTQFQAPVNLDCTKNENCVYYDVSTGATKISKCEIPTGKTAGKCTAAAPEAAQPATPPVTV